LPRPDLAPRVAVAVVGIPIVLGLLHAGGWILVVPLAALAALGAGETHRLANGAGHRPFAGLAMAGAAALVVLAGWKGSFPAASPWILGAFLLVGGVAMLCSMALRWPEGAPLGAVASTLFAMGYGAVALVFIPFLRELPSSLGWAAGEAAPGWAGMWVVALPLVCTWVGDAAAYFAGSAWGRRKLAPAVSPNKSWVGAYAGVSAAALAGVAWLLLAGAYLPGMPSPGIGVVAVGGALLGVGAIVGDLFESVLKREAGVKDSGSVFPGHGGVLDRLDALIFTLPLAYGLLCLVGVEG